MRSRFGTLTQIALLSALLVAVPRPLFAAGAEELDIPYKKFVLDNGLTLLVHEDHKAPIVAVNVWYHVGSKNEKPGKTGFAHLFEHLMFNGSENFNDDYFKVMARIGATDLNGTTNSDRTNYFENVPVSALDTALWMESDRMGYMVGAIDQARLDEQRGVVQNEKRQGENEPYAVTEELITKASYPAAHPYSWTVIGSMDDLGAAALDDVKDWFRTYYGPSNAVLVIAGDIETTAAVEKVKKYFGNLSPGPPVAHQTSWIAKRTGTQRLRVEDRVPQARLYKVWNVPEFRSADNDDLNLVAALLSRGKSSRLYKRLVYDDRIATDVSAFVDEREIGGQFYVIATAQPGGDLAKVESAVDEEIAKFLEKGPTAAELERVKTQIRAGLIRGAERIGGFGGKSDLLAQCQVYAGDPECYKTVLARLDAATPATVQGTAKRWLADGVLNLEVHPFPDLKAAETGVDRSKLPDAGIPPAARFPKLERATLGNGLEIVLAERHAVPLVTFNLTLDAGYAADQFGPAGTADLAMSMLDEGTAKRNALQISDELAGLGANLRTGSDLDSSSVFLSALKSKLDASLQIFADVVLHPSFPASDFERLKKLQLAQIEEEKSSPFGMALRVFPALLFGQGHAYANPFTGSGYESTVSKITREDLVKFHQTWFKPNYAKLIVAGDTTMAEIRPKIEALFKDWAKGTAPKKNIQTVEAKDRKAVYIIDKPGALQSVVLAGLPAPARTPADEVAIEAMNNIVGGDFTARLNMNLREDKHWSYGAGTFIAGTKAQRPLLAYAPVQTDKTKDSLVEIMKEMSDIVGPRPATGPELDKAKDLATRTLPGQWETMGAVGASIGEILRYGLPDDYFTTYPDKVRALKLDDVTAAAKKVVRPEKLTWVVVGDRAKIEPEIRSLGWGEIRYLDADGNLVK